MELSDRKKKILEILVDDFIEDGNPISSKALADKHAMDYSSATIRSELANLEELGYLSQPHTSSGRVPMAKAYLYYVETILRNNDLTDKNLENIEKIFSQDLGQTEKLVRDIAKTVSDMTNYTTAMSFSSSVDQIIEDIKLVKLKANNLLLIVLTDREILKDNILVLKDEINEDYVENARGMLKEILTGHKLGDILNIDEKQIENAVESYHELFYNVLKSLREHISKSQKQNLVLEGENKIFDYKEFENVQNTQNFLSMISNKEELANMLGEDEEIEFSVKIGGGEGNSEDKLPKDCALVTAKFEVGGSKLQTGVIGPSRMDYKKVLEVLKDIKTLLNNLEGKKE